MNRDNIWRKRFKMLDDWFFSYIKTSREKYLSVFSDMREESGIIYRSQKLWKAFRVSVKTENDALKYRSPDFRFYVKGQKIPQSWAEQKSGSIAWMNLSWKIKKIEREQIMKGREYVFLVSANVDGSEIVLNIWKDLAAIIDLDFENLHDEEIKFIASVSLNSLKKGQWSKEKEVVVCLKDREVPALSVEVYEIQETY